jgi:putative ABC transport system substrate-binding protein
MKRREFIAATAALLVSPRPLPAGGPPRRVGYLDGALKNLPLFNVAGQHARSRLDRGEIVDYRSAEGRTERLSALAAELVTLKPDLLVGGGPQVALALKSATATIPIVFVAVFDPVWIGLVQSSARRLGRKTNRNPPGTGSWRLENRPLSQSEQPNAQDVIG